MDNGLVLSTDNPIDKVVGYQTGSATMSAFGRIDSLFDHGLPFTPLPLAKWSTSSSFDLSHDEMFAIVPFDASLTFRTNGEKLHVNGYSFVNRSLTVYWRVYYLMPSNVDVIVPPTDDRSIPFLIDTDLNYTKLINSGVLNSSSGNITHDLGYYPQVEAWWEESGWVNKTTSFAADNPHVRATTSQVQFRTGTFTTPSRWHYRIYEEQF